MRFDPAEGVAGISRVAAILVISVILVVAVVSAFFLVYNEGSSNPSSTSSIQTSSSGLILYSADAYVNESTALAGAFSKATGVQVAPPKSGGSLALARQIAQGDPASVFISVSKSAVQNATLQGQFGGWAIAFASDQIGIAYSNASLQNAVAKEVVSSYETAYSENTTTSWSDFFSNLTSGLVKVGISNPNADPAGFRAWVALEAAGQLFAGNESYYVDRMLTNRGNVTGGSAADLVAPLQTGQIQFLFIYKSAIESQHLNSIQLPSRVNLGNPDYNSFYSQFTYGTASGVQKGEAILLWITVPKESVDPTDSVKFVVFVIQNYPRLLKSFGVVDILPPRVFNDSALPAPLQQLVANGSLEYSGTL